MRIHQKKLRREDNTAYKSPSSQSIIFEEAVKSFEDQCQSIKHFCCQNCQMTGISLKPSQRNPLICSTCQASGTNGQDKVKDLPIWYDEKKNVQFYLPDELKCLREGEKLLIQQVAAYVPLQHLQSGQIGSRGHVCSFVQDISSICTVLPRLPDDVQFVKVVKKYLQEGGQIGSKMFVVRKKAVLDALKWLKKYNVEYSNIEIKESNLDWIENEDAKELPANLIEMDDEAAMNFPGSVDIGPSELQTLSGFTENSHNSGAPESILGMLPSVAPHLPKEKDTEIIKTLNAGLDQHNKKNNKTIQFPYADPTPVNEYDEDNSLFTRAFPWLFPGGYGDYGQFRNIKMNVTDWARNLLYYKDGRFAKGKIWCFLPLILQQEKRIKQVVDSLLMDFSRKVPKL